MTTTEPVLPVGLRLAGLPVVVVGGGPVAHRRVVALVAAGALVTVVSPTVTPGLEAAVTTGAVRHEARTYAEGDAAGAWLVVAATGRPDVDRQVEAEALSRKVFCVTPDEGRAGTVAVPAVAHHDGLTVAVLSPGDAGRSRSVRDAVQAGLTDGMLVDRTHRPSAPGVALVGGGPGDPGLMTLRARQLLAEADVVVTDHLAPQSVLAMLSPEVEVVDASKLPGGRSMAQEAINAALVSHALAGRRVVRLKGGDPFVFGRGMEELQACAAAGVAVEVVPGVSSATGVPGLVGVPVTHRGLTHEFVVVSGHLAPDHPDSLVDWAAMGRLRGTVVVLMGVGTAGAIADRLVAEGRDPATLVVVVEDGGGARQRVSRSTLGGLGEHVVTTGVRPPAVWVAGEVVRLADGAP